MVSEYTGHFESKMVNFETLHLNAKLKTNDGLYTELETEVTSTCLHGVRFSVSAQLGVLIHKLRLFGSFLATC